MTAPRPRSPLVELHALNDDLIKAAEFQPRLSERFGEANDYETDRERNAFAAGAQWWGRVLYEWGYKLPHEDAGPEVPA